MKLKRLAVTSPANNSWQRRVPNGIHTRWQRDQDVQAADSSTLTKYVFRLYAADTENSAMAYANLLAICKEHLFGRYSIEIVDVFNWPRRALADGIRMTPTVVRVTPTPAVTVVGTLRQTGNVLLAFGIAARSA